MARDLGTSVRKEIERRLGERLAAVPEVCAGWIFGSFGRGEPFEDVDVGLLLAAGSRVEPRFLGRLAGELERVTGRPRLEVDLKELRATPYHFQNAVLKEGRLLFCRDQVARVRYESEAMGRYLDYKPVRRFFLDALLDRDREADHGG